MRAMKTTFFGDVIPALAMAYRPPQAGIKSQTDDRGEKRAHPSIDPRDQLVKRCAFIPRRFEKVKWWLGYIMLEGPSQGALLGPLIEPIKVTPKFWCQLLVAWINFFQKVRRPQFMSGHWLDTIAVILMTGIYN